MLVELRIRELALLERVDLALDPGLNVISGETGEGKSLLLLAIALLLGERARKGLTRSGAKEATIEGRFRLSPSTLARVRALTDLVPEESEELCLRRVVLEDGSSRAYLDGALCPITLLARLGAVLVDVHGQGQQHSLHRSRERAAVLDRFGGFAEEVAHLEGRVRRYHELSAELTRLAEEADRRAERQDILHHLILELAEVSPTRGEESSLDAELRLLARSGDVVQRLSSVASEFVEDDGSFTEKVAHHVRGLQDFADARPELSALVDRLRSLQIECDDLGRTAAELARDIPADPNRQAEVENRLSTLRTLSRKHRVDADQLAERLQKLEAEAESLKVLDGRSTVLENERRDLLRILRKDAAEVLKKRRASAQGLEILIAEGLRELRMERARIQIVVEPENVGTDYEPKLGVEVPGPVQILVAANPGEPPQPLEKVASGGETARILLAIKGALAGAHAMPLLIFDEIDAGVGGRVGLPFGRRIAKIAAHHQVLVVTHLPQVAAFAQRHIRVRKHVADGRTNTEVAVLVAEHRLVELAEMLGVGGAKAAAMAQAQALLSEALA